MKPITEHLKGVADAHYIWAKGTVTKVDDPTAQSASRSSVRMAFAHRVRLKPTRAAEVAQPVCPPFHQHNSLHNAAQRWIFVGEKQGPSSTSFLPGTSTVNTNCIPRDGTIVRATRDLKVLVGKDPHWPGVTPQGQFLAAGTPIQIVGDISGYPYDATANPDFCRHDPTPQRDLIAFPTGHQKRYCVYIPFNPT
jgi:hypothetical protein